jgi:hypothetical protein
MAPCELSLLPLSPLLLLSCPWSAMLLMLVHEHLHELSALAAWLQLSLLAEARAKGVSIAVSCFATASALAAAAFAAGAVLALPAAAGPDSMSVASAAQARLKPHLCLTKRPVTSMLVRPPGIIKDSRHMHNMCLASRHRQ